ncbi:hypothetical protein Bca4012_030406 [Brassica carinata]
MILICILSRRFSRRIRNLNSRSANEDEIQYLRESSFVVGITISAFTLPSLRTRWRVYSRYSISA